MQAIEYKIIPIEPRAHRFLVQQKLLVSKAQQSFMLYMPTWIPGSYLIRDFAKQVLSLSAKQAEQVCLVSQVDRQSWQVQPKQTGELLLEYEIYAHDRSVRAAFLDDLQGFFNPTSLCLRVAGFEHLPCNVEIQMPPEYGSWQVVTTLPAQQVHGNGFGHYRAKSYWDLIDHPVAMGRTIRKVAFSVAGVPHAFVILGPVNDVDTEQLAYDLSVICDTQASVFGEIPAENYLFMALITPQGLGGIEHRNCSVLQVARHALPRSHHTERSKAYEMLLGLCSHEYFHLWNVKRICPQAVAESDLTSEAYFNDLWAYEGVTSYYDDLALVRSGVISEQKYFQRLADTATRIERTPGQARQSLAQSSFDAWLKFYKPDENTPNAVVSYYGKGALFAWGLDLILRRQSQGRYSLDTLMQRLWDDFGEAGKPVPQGQLEKYACELGGPPVRDYFNNCLYDTKAIAWPELIQDFGLEATQQASDNETEKLRAYLGLKLSKLDVLATIENVYDNEPAQRAGLAAGDQLVAINGLAARRPLKLLDAAGFSAVIRVHVLREDALIVRDVTLGQAPAWQWAIGYHESQDAQAVVLRQQWLGL